MFSAPDEGSRPERAPSPGVAARGHQRRELGREGLQLRAVAAPAPDRAIVELLGDLRVAGRRRITAILVEPEARLLERQGDVVEQTTGLNLLIGYKRLVAQLKRINLHLACIVIHEPLD